MKLLENANKKMEPVFTLPYSEFRVATRLADLFKKKEGFSVLLPSSRTEKGFDLGLLKHGVKRSIITIQVKASRTWEHDEEYRTHETRFSRFAVPDEADWIFLVGIYPPGEGKTRKSGAIWWQEVILCFRRKEMVAFLKKVKTKKEGKPDKFFSFGFAEPTKIRLTRGDQHGKTPDYSSHLLKNKVREIRQSLS
jgi:hypothetical protein